MAEVLLDDALEELVAVVGGVSHIIGHEDAPTTSGVLEGGGVEDGLVDHGGGVGDVAGSIEYGGPTPRYICRVDLDAVGFQFVGLDVIG